MQDRIDRFDFFAQLANSQGWSLTHQLDAGCYELNFDGLILQVPNLDRASEELDTALWATKLAVAA